MRAAVDSNTFFIDDFSNQRGAEGSQRIRHAIVRGDAQIGAPHERRGPTALRASEIQRVFVSPRDLELAGRFVEAQPLREPVLIRMQDARKLARRRLRILRDDTRCEVRSLDDERFTFEAAGPTSRARCAAAFVGGAGAFKWTVRTASMNSNRSRSTSPSRVISTGWTGLPHKRCGLTGLQLRAGSSR